MISGKMFSRKVLALVLTLAILLQGCESSSDFVATGGALAPEPGVTTTTRTGTFSLRGSGSLAQLVSGTVWLEEASPATVRLFLHNGEPRVEATLDDGRVMLADLSQPEVDSLVLLGQQGQGPYEPGHWVWVTPVSTLLAVYRDLHPQLSHTERLSRLKDFLGISARESINRPFSSVENSQFRPSVFLERAGDSDLVEFSRELIAQVEAGRAQSIWDDPTEVPPNPGPSRFIGFVDNVGAGLVTDIIWKALGFAVGKTILGNSTKTQLADIENQLSEISTQLQDIESNLAGLGTGTLAASIDTAALQPLYTYYTKEKAMLDQSEQDYTPFSFDNADFLASSQLQALTNASSETDALGYAEDIVGACLNSAPSSGQGNLLTGFAQSRASLYGSGTSSFNGSNTAFYYDFRNDVAVTGALQQGADYYLGYLGHAGNMLAESLTAALGNNLSAPAIGIQQAQAYINGTALEQTVQGEVADNGVMALARRIQQQRPLALFGGQSALATIWAAPALPETVAGTGNVNGTFWAACVEVTEADTDKGPGQPIYLDTVGQFTVNGYYNWFLPSKSEVEALCQSAAQAAKADGIGSASQQVPYGLHKLGLLSDANYKSGMDNVGIYFKLATDSKNNPSCEVYETKDGSTDSGMYEAGLNAYGFSPSKSNVRLVLLVRPFPGLPQGAGGKAKNATATGAAGTTGPEAVVNSNSANQVRGAGNTLYMWNTGLALAGNIPPSEIVVSRDANSNQLRAYGIWVVGWPVVPSVYFNTNQTFDNLSKFYPNLGPTPSQYLVYLELTDMVEWLSSNTNAVEVSNYAESHTMTYGGTATGVTLSGPELLVEDPVLQTVGSTTRITGGKVLVGRLIEPSQNFAPTPNLSGATSSVLGTPVGNVDPSGGTVSGGSLTEGLLDSGQPTQVYSLTETGGAEHTIVVGGEIRDATIENARLTLAPGSVNVGGVVRVRDASQSATITASWMTSPSTTTLTNTTPSTATFETGALTVAGSSVLTAPNHRSLVLSPNYTKVQLKTGGQNLVFYTTAFLADGTCTDLSTSSATVYSVFQQVGNDQTFVEVPSALISFGGVDAGGDPVQPNVMKVSSSFNNYSGTLIIRAVNGSDSGYSFIQVLAP